MSPYTTDWGYWSQVDSPLVAFRGWVRVIAGAALYYAPTTPSGGRRGGRRTDSQPGRSAGVGRHVENRRGCPGEIGREAGFLILL
jgi:hypothetical protein